MPKARKHRCILKYGSKGEAGPVQGGIKKQSKTARTSGSQLTPLGPNQTVHKLHNKNKLNNKPANGGSHEAKGSAYTRKIKSNSDGLTMLRCAGVVDRQAATAVKVLLTGDAQGAHGRSIKSLTLAPHIASKKATYAIVCQAMKFYLVLSEIIERAGLVESISGLKPGTLAQGANIPLASCSDAAPSKVLCPFNMLILVYEILLGQGLHSSGGGLGPAERVVMKHKDNLTAALQQIMQERGVKDAHALLPKDRVGFAGVPHPRSVRVNPLCAGRTLEAVLQLLRCEVLPKEWKGVSRATHGACRQVTVDPLLPDVLLLPPGTDMHNHPLVAEGTLILQSRASCMPAHALKPRPGWTCVDCCAAPGNKTTHVAALMQGQGRIIAFDKDGSRLQRLQATAQRTGAAGVIDARCQDVLSIDPADPEFAEVKGVILDPSCSGSGTVFTRMDHLLPSFQRRQQQLQQRDQKSNKASEDEDLEPDSSLKGSKGGGENLTGGSDSEGGYDLNWDLNSGGADKEGDRDGKVGGLQGSSSSGNKDAERIRHLAGFQMRVLRLALRFPSLERLVYSTCSIHQEENEEVVMAVLEQAKGAGLDLVDPFPSWPRRGLPLFPGSDKLVRTDAFQDGTDGFFVAAFARIGSKNTSSGASSKKKKKLRKNQLDMY